MQLHQNVFFVLVLACLASACAGSDMNALPKRPDPQRTPVLLPEELPLPADVQITPPGADIPPHYAVFVGKWGGRWVGSRTPVLLVVEGVKRSGEMRGIYVWGELPGEARQRGTWRYRAQIRNGVFQLGSNARLVFKLMPDGSLLVNHHDDKGVLTGELTLTRIR